MTSTRTHFVEPRVLPDVEVINDQMSPLLWQKRVAERFHSVDGN